MKRKILPPLILIMFLALPLLAVAESNSDSVMFDQEKNLFSVKKCYGDIKVRVHQDISAPDYRLKDCAQSSTSIWVCSCSKPSVSFIYSNLTKNDYKFTYSYQITPENYDWSTLTDSMRLSINSDGEASTFDPDSLIEPLIVFGIITLIIFGILIFLVIKNLRGGDAFEEL